MIVRCVGKEEHAREKEKPLTMREYVNRACGGLGAGSTALLAVGASGQLLREDNCAIVACRAKASEAEDRAGKPYPAGSTGGGDLTATAPTRWIPTEQIKVGGERDREKRAQASLREIIIIDESKLSPVLGTHWPLPVEVVPFGGHSQRRFLTSLGARVTVRQHHDGTPFRTDQGNLILDCAFGPILRPAELAAKLDARTGIVEHGLFIGLATEVIVATVDGIRQLTTATARP